VSCVQRAWNSSSLGGRHAAPFSGLVPAAHRLALSPSTPPSLLQKYDVWSCGVLLYILVTGMAPFQRVVDGDLGSQDKARAIMQRTLELNYFIPPWVSKECQDLIMKMLEPGMR
jgi:serine/threonine protein kinase